MQQFMMQFYGIAKASAFGKAPMGLWDRGPTCGPMR